MIEKLFWNIKDSIMGTWELLAEDPEWGKHGGLPKQPGSLFRDGEPNQRFCIVKV